MGKVKKTRDSSSLGKSLIKDKSKRDKGTPNEDGWLHTSELADGYDWGRLNLQSVTEESDLKEFLSTAKLAGTEFTAEKLNITFVTDEHNSGLPSAAESEAIREAQEEHKQYLSVPRRPEWDSNTTPDQLAKKELDSFLAWRRNLAKLQENEKLIFTPFERNIDFWRQLWRVIERSDVVVQIVDARNPLLFRCEDLENYVKEVCSMKTNVLLLSKADLLSPSQREIWAEYFDKQGVNYAFWSAHLEAAKFEELSKTAAEPQDDKLDHSSEERQQEDEEMEMLPRAVARGFQLEDECVNMATDEELQVPQSTDQKQHDGSTDQHDNATIQDNDDNMPLDDKHVKGDDDTACSDEEHAGTVDETAATVDGTTPDLTTEHDTTQVNSGRNETVPTEDTRTLTAVQLEEHSSADSDSSDDEVDNVDDVIEQATQSVVTSSSMEAPASVNPKAKLLTGDELLDLFRSLCSKKIKKKPDEPAVVVGMVGYPNVGKSSTINTLIHGKKVPVSATPGRTKHFQTLYADDDVLLCDCPGLVFPSFVSTKAEMVCSGILPIDQMRDYVGPVTLVCRRVPRPVLEGTYGLILPTPKEGEDENRPAYASELLNAYGYVRGFMTSHGQPDCSRGSRHILKDYVMGKLLYCFPPPDYTEPELFNSHLTVATSKTLGTNAATYDPSQDLHLPSMTKVTSNVRNPDSAFLYQERVNMHSKGRKLGTHVAGPGDHHDDDDDTPEGQDVNWDQASTTSYASNSGQGKPWKKHFNKNKKQKIKRQVKKMIEN